MHGLSPEGSSRLTKEEWSVTVHDADREQVVSKLQCYLNSGETYRIRYRTVGADGTVRWVMGMGKAVRGSDGEPRRLVGINLEITRLAALIDHGDEDDVSVGAGGNVLPRGDEAVDKEDLTAAVHR
jgi:PAS domain S-box-containing protein